MDRHMFPPLALALAMGAYFALYVLVLSAVAPPTCPDGLRAGTTSPPQACALVAARRARD
jgi:hypothetical protein